MNHTITGLLLATMIGFSAWYTNKRITSLIKTVESNTEKVDIIFSEAGPDTLLDENESEAVRAWDSSMVAYKNSAAYRLEGD